MSNPHKPRGVTPSEDGHVWRTEDDGTAEYILRAFLVRVSFPSGAVGTPAWHGQGCQG